MIPTEVEHFSYVYWLSFMNYLYKFLLSFILLIVFFGNRKFLILM